MSEATLKPEKDFSKEVDKQLPEAETLAHVRLSSQQAENPKGLKAD